MAQAPGGRWSREWRRPAGVSRLDGLGWRWPVGRWSRANGGLLNAPGWGGDDGWRKTGEEGDEVHREEHRVGRIDLNHSFV